MSAVGADYCCLKKIDSSISFSVCLSTVSVPSFGNITTSLISDNHLNRAQIDIFSQYSSYCAQNETTYSEIILIGSFISKALCN